jgi:para-nitrobenzyl esterase
LIQTAECLRGPTVTAAMLVGLRPRAIYPFIDGTLLTQPPGAAFASGNFNRVPVITGTNHDEYRYFVARDWVDPSLGLLPDGNYAATVDMVFGPIVGLSVVSQYPVPTGAPPDAASLALGTAGTDGIFACTARHAMQALAQYVTTYAYEFNDENAPVPAFPYAINFLLGAYHGADVQYLFNRGGIPAPFNNDQKQLSQTMIRYWTQFAKTGDPNSPGQPLWAPYDPVSDERLSFLPPDPVVESGFAADHQCTTFWDHL